MFALNGYEWRNHNLNALIKSKKNIGLLILKKTKALTFQASFKFITKSFNRFFYSSGINNINSIIYNHNLAFYSFQRRNF